jgi:hypothetical protein
MLAARQDKRFLVPLMSLTVTTSNAEPNKSGLHERGTRVRDPPSPWRPISFPSTGRHLISKSPNERQFPAGQHPRLAHAGRHHPERGQHGDGKSHRRAIGLICLNGMPPCRQLQDFSVGDRLIS